MSPLRFALALSATTLLLAAPAAKAAVVVGMVAPATPDAVCTGPADVVQESPSVNYEIPSGIASPVVTSWSTAAAAGGGQQLSLKVFEKIAEPAYFRQVAHDGPRLLTGGMLNTFITKLPVKAGDFLGLGVPAGSAPTACIFGSAIGSRTHNVYFNDGDSGLFAAQTGYANVSAVVEPSNDFTIAAIRRNKKKGTAKVSVSVPGPGSVALSGKGVLAQRAAAQDPAATKAVTGAGTATLRVKAKGRKRQRLNRVGRVKVKLSITYTPTGGTAATQSRKLKLRKA